MINFNKFINEASKNELRVSLRHAPEAIEAYNDGRWSKMSKMKGSDVYVFKKEDDMLDFYDTLTSDWDIPEEEITMNESKIQLKRKYTENYPAITAGKSARVRNKMLEAIADGRITQEEFDAILKEFSKDSNRWMRRNSKYFNVSEEGISLSKFGRRALDQISVNEGNAFLAARAKAIEEDAEEFEFNGKIYPVITKENKTNNKMKKEFVHESFKSFLNESSVNEAKANPKAYQKAGKLGYNDQFLGRQSLSKTLSLELGLNPKNEFGGGDWLGFDHISLYASGGEKKGTILDDALSGKYTYDELKAAAAEFLGVKESVNEAEELITEKFKSMKLQSILTGAGSMPKDFAKTFYTMSKLALSDIQDVDIIEMDPGTAKKEKRNNAVYLYFTDNEKKNPYFGKNSWGVSTIPGNTLLAATDGKNEWLVSEYQSRFGGNREKTLRAGKRDVSVGFGKSGARDTWGSGISSLTKAVELADRAYVLDLDILRARYSTKAKREERAAAKKGATAFKNDKDFKKENLNRYHDILANRAAKMPIDKEVKKAIDVVADQIKAGLASGKTGKYNDVIIGEDPKGREVRLRDASNAMSSLLDDFNRYVEYTNSAAKEKEAGYGDDYYAREVKNYAKSIKDRIAKIEKMDYAW